MIQNNKRPNDWVVKPERSNPTRIAKGPRFIRLKFHKHAIDLITPDFSKLPLGPPLESHRKQEPPPEFDDLKSSPDHPKHLTTGNNQELNHDTEKPPPTTVLEL